MDVLTCVCVLFFLHTSRDYSDVVLRRAGQGREENRGIPYYFLRALAKKKKMQFLWFLMVYL
jgi:hypothetical protein